MTKSVLPKIAGLALISTIILIILCLTASAYISASEDMQQANKKCMDMDNYYAAETTACEILDGFSDPDSENSSLTSGQSGKVTYDAAQGNILIVKNSGGVSFSVPINSQKELEVVANVSGDSIDILKWCVGKR